MTMQAAQAQTSGTPTPAAPQAPAEAPLPTVTIDGVPQSFGDVRALRAQRTELSNQLRSAQGRRDDVVEQLKTASSAERPGLEARLKLLDERILEIESEISRTGELIAKTPGNLLSGSQAPQPIQGLNMNSGDITGIIIVFTIFVLTPIAITISRLIWKRGSNPTPRKADPQAEERMRRLEAGIDAIAIEVERISEGQRFMTKLMAEREKQAALPNRES